MKLRIDIFQESKGAKQWAAILQTILSIDPILPAIG